jgi:signal transduction histidine kinase
LLEDNSHLALSIQNDGRSLPEAEFAGKGMGLRIMQYRANLINANLTIKPADGGGTVITCVLNRGEAK